MEAALSILIPLSVVLVFIIGVVFWWSVRSGQYDDLEGPAYQILFNDRDDGRVENTESSEKNDSDEKKPEE